jgi:tungstate transport system ATP-binding protein
MTPGATVYRLEAVRHQYTGRVVLDIEALDVRQGETLAVIGPSGSGKSTLLRLLQFIERPSSGRLWFEGREVTAEPPLDVRRRVTTVFQRPVVLSRTVRSNLAYGLRVRRVKARPSEIDHLLDGLGLAPLAHAPAPTLSGGEMQRVSFARALAFDPEVLLLDEPTANLDPRNVRLVEGMIRERQAQGVTMVLATHQIFQARRLAHRTALLLDGQIVEAGPTAHLLDHPADPRTKAFLSGDMVY